MRKHGWGLAAIVIVLSLALLLFYLASVQSTVSITSTELRVYRDGLVHIEQALTIDEFLPQASVTLLSSKVENLVVLDGDELAVDYELKDKTLEIYSLGATHVNVEYDVNTLTSKENEVWTLLLDSPYSVGVSFPINSSIIYLNGTPTSIDTTSGQLSLTLGSGQWEISYILQLAAGYEDLYNTDQSQNAAIPTEYLVAAVIAVVAVVLVVGVFLLKRKSKPNVKKTLNANPTLMKEDRAVIEFLAEKDGKAFEAEIRERFPEMPRTSLWRLIKRLEKLEIVEVKKIGLENQVSLKK
ncbi:MAG: hypothetical protein NWE92_03955 [Candidatus Bathyarchaeota archaeon]|nr:hypothetical protein [Candidatus Bathyarchaeota archaeon]